MVEPKKTTKTPKTSKNPKPKTSFLKKNPFDEASLDSSEAPKATEQLRAEQFLAQLHRQRFEKLLQRCPPGRPRELAMAGRTSCFGCLLMGNLYIWFNRFNDVYFFKMVLIFSWRFLVAPLPRLCSFLWKRCLSWGSDLSRWLGHLTGAALMAHWRKQCKLRGCRYKWQVERLRGFCSLKMAAASFLVSFVDFCIVFWWVSRRLMFAITDFSDSCFSVSLWLFGTWWFL